MIDIISLGLSLLLVYSGIRGLIEGKISVGLGSRTGGGSEAFSITLTGNRAFLFSILVLVEGLIIAIVWIALFQRVNQVTQFAAMWKLGAASIVISMAIGGACAWWEKSAAPKLPIDEQRE